MKRLRNAAILIGLAAYAFFFYATVLPSLSRPTETWRRGRLVFVALFRPDEWLWPNWFGVPPQFSFLDRVPILLAAGLILAWALALGWLALSLVRATRGLARLETAVFSMAVGLSLLSTWTLALGLLGQLGRLRSVAAPALLTFLIAAGYGYWRRRSQSKNQRPVAPRRFGNLEDRLAAAVVQSGVEATVQRAIAPERGVGAAVQLPPQQGSRQQRQRPRTASPPNRIGPFSPHERAEVQRREAIAAAYRHCVGFVRRRWLWLALPFVTAILLAAMLPPMEFDACEYHLQAPKEFYQRGAVTFVPHNVYANMPLGAEMLALLAMTMVHDWWWGALVGKTVIAAFTPLCGLGLLAAGRRFHSAAAGVIAALVYISIPWLTSTSFMPNVNVTSSGLIEGASACYLFLALFALLLSRKQGGAGAQFSSQQQTHPAAMLALAGYLAGAAVATKYPAVLFVLIPMAVWALVGRSWRNQSDADRRQAARDSLAEPLTPTPPVVAREPGNLNPLAALAVFLLASALACGLWFGKNWVLTGNPTYPLLYGVFDGSTWNASKEMRWDRAHWPHDFSIETLGKDLGGVLMTSEWLSPLVVPLALLALLAWADRPAVFWQRLRWELLAYAVFVIAAWWLFTHRIDRFWLPVLPVLALLAGAGACWTFQPWWRRILKGLLLAGLAANFLVSAAGPGNAWFVPLEQLRNDPPWITPSHAYLNEHADRGAVLAVGDAAVFDLKPTVLYNTCFDDCVFEQLVRGKTDHEIRAEFAAMRIAYVLVDWQEIERYRRPGNYGFSDFVQSDVFAHLVNEGILEPVPQAAEAMQRIYRVKR